MKRKVRRGSIGIFDSGFGGLTILKEIVKELPEYDYIYFGDTARTPYGNRPMKSVYEFTKQAVDFLFAEGCELIVLACNTASATALRKIQQEYLPARYPKRKRVLGVIVPALEESIIKTKNNRVGLIATRGTVNSGTFKRELKMRDPKIRLFSQSAPLLVPLVESGKYASKAAKRILARYLKPLFAKKIDTLILGCTHYGILEPEIRKLAGKNVHILSEGKIVARKLVEYLARHLEIDSTLSKRSKRVFYTTDRTERFQKLGSVFFGQRISALKTKLN
ncbi:glutamate racemase [Candidatus Kaiserbacteria bacterium]|nr:glutamate racemase [Candidatus Kaiserbacteria bacterium]